MVNSVSLVVQDNENTLCTPVAQCSSFRLIPPASAVKNQESSTKCIQNVAHSAGCKPRVQAKFSVADKQKCCENTRKMYLRMRRWTLMNFGGDNSAIINESDSNKRRHENDGGKHGNSNDELEKEMQH